MTLPRAALVATASCVVPFSFQRSITKAAVMAGDQACTNALLAAVLGSDPMLSAAVMARAAAATPPGKAPPLTLPSAISRLGMGMVQGLIGEVRRLEDEWQRVMAGSWGLANATATMLRLLIGLSRSEELKAYDEDTLHLCGLLHDLGAITTMRLFRTPYLRAVRAVTDGPVTLRKALRRELGADDAEIGGLVAQAWRLPEPIASCIRHHHRPGRAGRAQHLVGAVHVARGLVRGCGFTAAGDAFVTPIDEQAMDELGLAYGEIETAIRLFHEEMDELEVYEGVLPG